MDEEGDRKARHTAHPEVGAEEGRHVQDKASSGEDTNPREAGEEDLRIVPAVGEGVEEAQGTVLLVGDNAKTLGRSN